MTGRTIALLTDFGLDDPYAGQMRAVLATLLPDCQILDISHGVPPHAISSGALFLAASLPFFPESTLFLAVVDPGVGSGRDVLAITGARSGRILIGPDNGLLSLAVQAMAATEELRCFRLPAHPAGIDWQRAYNGTAPAMHRAASTFHGRDYFPLLAERILNAHLPSEAILCPPPAMPGWSKAEAVPDGYTLSVLHVDRYGNAILNLPVSADISGCCELVLSGCECTPVPVSNTFSVQTAACYTDIADGCVGLLPGSQGYWELACRERSAAAFLNLSALDTCQLLRSPA